MSKRAHAQVGGWEYWSEEAVAALQTYNPDAVCPKCNCQQVDTQFRRECQVRARDMPVYEPRRMERTCSNCGYTWYERPLDGTSWRDEQALT